MTLKPKWRNWQTRWIQNPVQLTLSVGSSPTFGTLQKCAFRNIHIRNKLRKAFFVQLATETIAETKLCISKGLNSLVPAVCLHRRGTSDFTLFDG
jgi:hypothetical protein